MGTARPVHNGSSPARAAITPQGQVRKSLCPARPRTKPPRVGATPPPNPPAAQRLSPQRCGPTETGARPLLDIRRLHEDRREHAPGAPSLRKNRPVPRLAGPSGRACVLRGPRKQSRPHAAGHCRSAGKRAPPRTWRPIGRRTRDFLYDIIGNRYIGPPVRNPYNKAVGRDPAAAKAQSLQDSADLTRRQLDPKYPRETLLSECYADVLWLAGCHIDKTLRRSLPANLDH